MPTVPRVSVPDVQAAPQPDVRIQAQPGYGSAEAMGNAQRSAADVLERIGLNMQAKADDAAIFGARTKLAEWESQQFDPSNPNGVYASKGKNALHVPDTVMADYQQHVQQIKGGLSNSVQAAAFDRMATQFGLQVRNRLQSYAVQQNDAYIKETNAAAQQSMLDRASAAASDGRMDDMTQEVNLAHAQIEMVGRQNGEPAAYIDQQKEAFSSRVLASAVDGMLSSGQYDRAVKFYHANRDDMTMQDRARIDGAVRNADLLTQTQTQSQQIIAKYGSGSAAVSEAQKIEDPVLRKHVITAIDQEGVRREREQNAYDRAMKDKAYSAVFKADPATPIDKAVPPDVLSHLDPTDVLSLQAFQERRLKGTATKTDPRVFEKLDTMPDAELSKQNINSYYVKGQLSASDRDHLIKKQEQIDNPKKAPNWGSDGSMFQEAFQSMGVPSTGADNQAKRGAFRARYYEAVRKATESKGKDLTDDERWKIMNDLMLKVSRENSHLFGLFHTTETHPLYQVPAQDLKDYKVPEDVRNQIVQRFKAHGITNPTDAQVRSVYFNNAEKFNQVQP